MNDFHADLAYSLDTRDDQLFDEFYKKAFPGAVDIEFCEDKERQKQGIDKIVHFRNGKQVTVDEKKRRTDYGDILLELRSNDERDTPGWLFYSQCDYIVYAVLCSNKVYLLPTLLLKMAYKRNHIEWGKQYPIKYSPNGLYRTRNIPIPTDVLLSAIRAEMQQAV